VKSIRLAALALAGAATPSFAGPPYLTDDPVPTDRGRWEIYGFTSGEGIRSTVDVDAGLDINYGGFEDVQLTATLPFSFSHDPKEGWRSGSDNLELAAKYRFLNDKHSGLSAAIFPRVILPTASHSPGDQARLLLPLWAQKDFAGGTSIFGGGGYVINPGAGNRDFWQAAIAVTQNVNKKVSVGAEITRQGADTVRGTPQTRAGVGSIVKLFSHYSLLFSGGPTWANDRTGYHFYAALGLNY
jgi:hypothetical protein